MFENITGKFSEWKYQKGKTLRECAKLLDIDHAYLCRVLAGKQKPSSALLVNMTEKMRWEKSSHQVSHHSNQAN